MRNYKIFISSDNKMFLAKALPEENHITDEDYFSLIQKQKENGNHQFLLSNKVFINVVYYILWSYDCYVDKVNANNNELLDDSQLNYVLKLIFKSYTERKVNAKHALNYINLLLESRWLSKITLYSRAIGKLVIQSNGILKMESKEWLNIFMNALQSYWDEAE